MEEKCNLVSAIILNVAFISNTGIEFIMWGALVFVFIDGRCLFDYFCFCLHSFHSHWRTRWDNTAPFLSEHTCPLQSVPIKISPKTFAIRKDHPLFTAAAELEAVVQSHLHSLEKAFLGMVLTERKVPVAWRGRQKASGRHHLVHQTKFFLKPPYLWTVHLERTGSWLIPILILVEMSQHQNRKKMNQRFRAVQRMKLFFVQNAKLLWFYLLVCLGYISIHLFRPEIEKHKRSELWGSDRRWNLPREAKETRMGDRLLQWPLLAPNGCLLAASTQQTVRVSQSLPRSFLRFT